MKIQGDLSALCRNPELVKAMIKKMEDYGRSQKLTGLELLKKIHLEEKSFVLLNLTTTTLKIVRNKCKEHYKDMIEELYKE